MAIFTHERPGVYTSYEVSSVASRGRDAKVIGLCASAASGIAGQAYTVTGYAQGLGIFQKDGANDGMMRLLELMFRNGASTVVAIRVTADTVAAYETAFEALLDTDASIIVCQSAGEDVQKKLRDHVTAASANRRERIAVCGAELAGVDPVIQRAQAINSERVILVSCGATAADGAELNGAYTAAALAAALASGADPAAPVNGAALSGFIGLSESYGEADIDLLVRGGVTPLECVMGEVSVVRGVTTRTKTAGVTDNTWREITTVMIIDDLIPAIRDSLHARFSRKKNTESTRGAIRSQIIVELEAKKAAQIIDAYGTVTVAPKTDDPTVCVAEFEFAVAHGLNQIHLSASILV